MLRESFNAIIVNLTKLAFLYIWHEATIPSENSAPFGWYMYCFIKNIQQSTRTTTTEKYLTFSVWHFTFSSKKNSTEFYFYTNLNNERNDHKIRREYNKNEKPQILEHETIEKGKQSEILEKSIQQVF